MVKKDSEVMNVECKVFGTLEGRGVSLKNVNI